MEPPELPVIDLGPFRESTSNDDVITKEQLETAAKIRRACIEHGFFYVVNHGVDKTLLDEAFSQTESLFGLPSEKKSDLSSKKSPLFRGYISLTDGLHTCNADHKHEVGFVDDQKESFTIGAEQQRANLNATSPMHGPNQWPDKKDLPLFQRSIEAYWEAQIHLSRVIARGLAVSLDLSPSFFDPFLTDPVAQMVLLKYPPPPETLEKSSCVNQHPGCGEHTDCGFLTILAQTLPGLEVQDPQTNEWKSICPLEGAFVVNLGDMAARWTNDAYRSTKHRVYNTNPNTRYSIPFFCNCNFDAPIECIVTGHEKNTNGHNTNGGVDESSSANRSEPNVAKYEPTTAGMYILDRLGLMRLVE